MIGDVRSARRCRIVETGSTMGEDVRRDFVATFSVDIVAIYFTLTLHKTTLSLNVKLKIRNRSGKTRAFYSSAKIKITVR